MKKIMCLSVFFLSSAWAQTSAPQTQTHTNQLKGATVVLQTPADDLSPKIAKLCAERSPPTKPNPELAKSINNLLTIYGSAEARKKNPDEYLHQLNEVLNKTAEGAELYKCFSDLPGYRHSPTFTDGSGFTVEYQELKTGKFQKQLVVDPTPTPQQALVFYAMALRKSCDAAELQKLGAAVDQAEAYANSIKNPLKIPEAGNALEQAHVNETQESLVSDLEGYRSQVKVFRELAPYNCPAFCDFKYFSGLRGKEVTMGEHYADFEKQLAAGTLPGFTANSLIKRDQNPKDKSLRVERLFYQVNLRPSFSGVIGTPVLGGASGKELLMRNDLKMRLQAMGFNVSP